MNQVKLNVRKAVICTTVLACAYVGCQERSRPTLKATPTLDEKRQLAGHKGRVWELALSADGKLLASAGADHMIRLWDFESGKPLGTLVGHQDEVTGLTLDPKGRWLASASPDKTVRIWDLEKQKERQTLGDGEVPFRHVRFSQDGTYLAASGHHVFYIWDVGSDGSAKVRHRIEDQYIVGPGYIDFIGDGKRVAVNYALRIGSWDADAGDTKESSFGSKNLGEKYLWWFAFSRDGKLLVSFDATEDDEGIVKFWKLPDREPSVKIPFERRVFMGALSPDSKLLATCGRDLPITLWNTSSGEQVAASKGLEGDCFSLLFSNDGKKLVSGGGDGVIRVWEVPNSNR
jgi:WD40 repeat protein